MGVASAIARLETVLATTGHPLGDPTLRPHQRDSDEMAAAGRELLGLELSAELREVWNWWTMGWTLAELPKPLQSLDESELMLPGGIYLRDVEFAHERITNMRDSAIVNSPSDLMWVPFAAIGDRLTVWCDVSDARAPESPVAVGELVHPSRATIFRIGSIAALIEVSADLMEQGWWVEDDYEGWVYDGPRGEFWF